MRKKCVNDPNAREKKHRLRRDGKQRDRRKLNGRDHWYFQRMVTHARAHVELNIGVVDSVNSPEGAHRVEGVVRHVTSQVKRQDAG